MSEKIYWSLSFWYPGPYGGILGDDDESIEISRHCASAEERAVQAMKDVGVEFAHQYSWPDGSIYYWARSEDPEFISKLTAELSKVGMRLRDNEVCQVDKDFKVDWKAIPVDTTLEQYITNYPGS